MRESNLDDYIEKYKSVEPKEPDSHVILYAYNSMKGGNLALVSVTDLLAMFKYIETKGAYEEYEKDYNRLVYYLNKLLGSNILTALRRY